MSIKTEFFIKRCQDDMYAVSESRAFRSRLERNGDRFMIREHVDRLMNDGVMATDAYRRAPELFESERRVFMGETSHKKAWKSEKAEDQKKRSIEFSDPDSQPFSA